jgi:hypothetical protein
MRLHQWTSAEVESHLSGDAEILRGTYFGELVLTPDVLTELHNGAVAPIARRWQPEVHQTIQAERQLRRILGDADAWCHLLSLCEQLKADAAAVQADLIDLVDPFAGIASDVARYAQAAATALANAYTHLTQGDLDLLRQKRSSDPGLPDRRLSELPRKLRATRQRAALSVTNALADGRSAHRILEDLDVCLETRLVAVVAEAGYGKTQLAAQLTVALGNRPAGILLPGSGLHAGNTPDDLARRVVVHGMPVPAMEALLAAVDAAGQRAHQRLPIVIDGLNEAEDPRKWKDPLASLEETLRRYPYVLLVCTLRNAFAKEALPPDILQLEMLGFERDAKDAIRRYFTHYKINGADLIFPWEFLHHPLTLRLFCEVTNPTRERLVGIEATPGSLTALFDRYLDQAASRIAELAPRVHRYYEANVRAAITQIGAALWEQMARTLSLQAIRRHLGDEARAWNESIITLLEQEGVLLRYPGPDQSDTHIAVAYDALAGHMVAEALLSKYGREELGDWLAAPGTVNALSEAVPGQHPLGADILRALAGLIPRRLYGQQLWPLLNDPLRTVALRKAAYLEGKYLDALTVGELANLAVRPHSDQRELFWRLFSTRGAPDHPLNAEFLGRVLRDMTVADRDLRWTEWLRRNVDEFLDDVKRLAQKWRSNKSRNKSDDLRARWVMWLLTSTVQKLRDEATASLYWFGRGDPSRLFELTLDSLSLNDMYVSERLLAASYGVVMAHQLVKPEFAAMVWPYLVGLRDALSDSRARVPTNHWLARLYVQGTVSFALRYYRATVPEGLEQDGRVLFASGRPIEPIGKDDTRTTLIERTIQMDFENYTLGRLFHHRRIYDMANADHQAAVAHVLGTVWALGWHPDRFRAIDNAIAEEKYRHYGITRTTTERYGKKYGWIGFYTYAGMLADRGELPKDFQPADSEIDPSFPDPPATALINIPNWASAKPADDRRWIAGGKVKVPDELLYAKEIASQPGPWIAAYADLNTKDEVSGRRVFGQVRTLLVAPGNVVRLVNALNAKVHPGGWWLPEAPSDSQIFAGEIPWSRRFGQMEGDPESPYRGTVEIAGARNVQVEILAHIVNRAGGAFVPSRPFSESFDLRSAPELFDQTTPDGTLAAISCNAPVGFGGHLLYMREDLVRRYVKGRQLIWFIWGERQLDPSRRTWPEWLVQMANTGKDIWRQVRRVDELSRTFASKPLSRTRRSARRSPRSAKRNRHKS